MKETNKHTVKDLQPKRKKSGNIFPQELTKKEMYERHFRVAIFGSARLKKDDKIYQQVFKLAQCVGKCGFDIVTGGGPGLMKAANSGHQAGRGNHNSHSFGLTIKLSSEEKANQHLDVKKQFHKFSRRLDYFMILSNIFVVMPGGIGTCLELFYTWQLTQVAHTCKTPIILYGEMWEQLYQWVKNQPLKKKFMSPEDINHIHCVKNNDEAMKIIQSEYEKYNEEGEDYCVNYKKYIVAESPNCNDE